MEHLIDIFARAPDSLSETDRDRIDVLLDEHPGAREYLEHLREFYRSFRELSTEDVPYHVRAFADSLVRLPRRLRLRPPAPRTAGSSPAHNVRFLHADSVSAPESVRAVGSLVCADFGVLVRLIEDRDAGELRGYVLSPDQGDAATALVLFEALDTACVTDESGVFRIPLTELDSPEHLLGGPVELAFPVQDTSLRPSDLSGESASTLFESESVRVYARRTAHGVKIDLTGGTVDDWLVIDSAGLRSLHRLSENTIELETDLNSDEISLRLYAG